VTVNAGDMGNTDDDVYVIPPGDVTVGGGGGASCPEYNGRAAKITSAGSANDLDAKDMVGCTAVACPKSRGCASSMRVAFPPSMGRVTRRDDSYTGTSLDEDDEDEDEELEDECEDEDELEEECEDDEDEECEEELEDEELDDDELDDDELEDEDDEGGFDGSHAQIALVYLLHFCAK